jgi:site-specific recombinase XerD
MSNLGKSRFAQAIRQAQLGLVHAQRIATLGITWKWRGQGDEKKLYMKLTYDGSEAIFSMGIKSRPDLFDPKTSTISGNPEATTICQNTRTIAYQIVNQLRVMEQPITVRLIRDSLLGVVNQDGLIVRASAAIEKHLACESERVAIGEILANSYRSKKRHISLFMNYLIQTYGKAVAIDEILPADAEKFIVYLKKQHGHTHNYTLKVVSAVKELLYFAVENKWLNSNPFANYRGKKEQKMGEILTEREVEKLVKLENLSPGLNRVRDVFMLQIFSGLCYADIRDLKAEHLLTTEQGERYFRKPRQKTGTVSIVPILPQAERLLEKYANGNEQGGLMPVISNAKMNQHLKKIARKANLTKCLTTHVARRTCATILINNGVPLTTVAKVLGHSNTVITQQSYAQVNPETVIRDIQKFANR